MFFALTGRLIDFPSSAHISGRENDHSRVDVKDLQIVGKFRQRALPMRVSANSETFTRGDSRFADGLRCSGRNFGRSSSLEIPRRDLPGIRAANLAAATSFGRGYAALVLKYGLRTAYSSAPSPSKFRYSGRCR
jgi:hypothetical protein